jgi:hypothetical protein
MVVSRSIRAGFSCFNPGPTTTPTTSGVPARCTLALPGYFNPGPTTSPATKGVPARCTLALPGYFNPGHTPMTTR